MFLSRPPADLHSFFLAKHTSGTVRLSGEDYDLEVWTPDLTRVRCRVSQDWTPTYTSRLPLEVVARVFYRCRKTGESAEYTIAPPSIVLTATGQAGDDRLHPFHLELIDAARALRIRIVLDQDGAPVDLAVYPISARVSVPPLLFREARRLGLSVRAAS